jgi:CGNR zinc finger
MSGGSQTGSHWSCGLGVLRRVEDGVHGFGALGDHGPELVPVDPGRDGSVLVFYQVSDGLEAHAVVAHGVVHLSSGGRASDLLRGRVLIEMYNAQLIGTWRRLKVCHNARCHEVFFDQSKNNSRTWFDTAACANALNLRAYRERRKAARFSDLSERDPG